MLDPRTAKKIHVLSAKQVFTALSAVIDPDDMPAEYGGLCGRPLPDSPYEHQLEALARQVNAGAGGGGGAHAKAD